MSERRKKKEILVGGGKKERIGSPCFSFPSAFGIGFACCLRPSVSPIFFSLARACGREGKLVFCRKEFFHYYGHSLRCEKGCYLGKLCFFRGQIRALFVWENGEATQDLLLGILFSGHECVFRPPPLFLLRVFLGLIPGPESQCVPIPSASGV